MQSTSEGVGYFKQFFIDVRSVASMSACKISLNTELLTTDADSVFLGRQFQELLVSKSIAFMHSPPYEHSLNPVERDMKTIGQLALATLSQSGFAMYMWEHAYATAVYCANRAYTRVHSCAEHQYLTPFERSFKIKPNISHTVKFGAKAFVFVEEKERQS